MMHRSPMQTGASALLVSSLVLLLAAPVGAQPCTGDNPAQNRYCGVPLIDGFGGVNGYGTQCLYPNDDGSSTSIDLMAAFPSGLRFFGTMHSAMYVNTNGNITFARGLGTYTPRAFPVASQPMIAPYWADVDIRGDGNGTGCDRSGTTCNVPSGAANGVYWTLEPGRIVVTWDRTGAYYCDDTRKMTFQLILTAAPGCGGEGDFDVEFRYAQCEWTTGTASGGSGGFGGTPAQAGFDAGNSTDFVEIVGSRTGQIHRILCEESNVGMPGIYRFQIRGGAVICPDAGAVCPTGALGVCGEGRTQCVGGGTTCQQVLEPSPERCDALDNDCDGSVDEGDAICSAVSSTATCQVGSCIETCFEGGCPPGLECGTDSRCYEAGCEGVTCAEGERCSAGACVAACSGIVCPTGQSCSSGRCVDLCATLTCDDCTVCEAGTCVSRCQFTSCAAGEVCQDDGYCISATCVGVTCPAGLTCREGGCFDACDGAVCPTGEECTEGMCVPLPVAPDAGPPARVDGSVEESDGGIDAGMSRADAGIDGGPRCRVPGCDPEGAGGCSCSVPGAGGETRGMAPAGIALMLAISLVWARRRRR